MDKTPSWTQYLQITDLQRADSVRLIKVIITNQIVLCKNWSDSDTIARHESHHFGLLQFLTREFMSQSDRCFLDQNTHVLRWDGPSKYSCKSGTTDPCESCATLLDVVVLRYFHFRYERLLLHASELLS